MIKNKRGNAIIDGAFIVVLTISVVIVVFFIYNIMSNINTEIQADDDFSDTSKEIMANSTATYPNFWDTALIFLLVIFWSLALITAYRIDTAPIFFVFTLIGIIVVLMATMSMEQYYNDMISDDDFSSYDTTFPKINWLMDHFVWVIMVICFSVGVVLHSKL